MVYGVYVTLVCDLPPGVSTVCEASEDGRSDVTLDVLRYFPVHHAVLGETEHYSGRGVNARR